jgi:hypothetical protein
VRPRERLRLFLAGALARRRLATVTADGKGRVSIRIALPQLEPDVYTPLVQRQGGAFVPGRARLAVRVGAVVGFGPLGAAACAPASPRSGFDVAGTSTGTRLWALFAFNPLGATLQPETVTFEDVVGKEVKIVFKMTSGVPSVFYARSPVAGRVAPVWGPERHTGSSWAREGAEWGAGFVFTSEGCWQIHAGSGLTQGDIWVRVLS